MYVDLPDTYIPALTGLPPDFSFGGGGGDSSQPSNLGEGGYVSLEGKQRDLLRK